MSIRSCPIPDSKWKNLVAKLDGNIDEAYRLYYRNGEVTPDFVFKTTDDVSSYLTKTYPDLVKLYNGKLRIKTGGDSVTYNKNVALIRKKVEDINKVYHDLLKIVHEPIHKLSEIRPSERTTIFEVFVNKKALDDHYLVWNTPTERSIRQRQEEGNWSVNDEGDVEPLYQQRINYTFRVIDALQKLQRGKFETSKLQGWINDLQKQGVPKEQLDMFKESAKDDMTKEQILASILANYSYSVEVNTSVLHNNKVSDFKYESASDDEDVRRLESEGWIYDGTSEDGEPLYRKPTTEYEKIKDSTRNTDYYSSMTVPGGTNYTENEIKTPDITPSIKGHVQFSTDQGIGWFRSDEQRKDTLTNEGNWVKTIIEVPNEFYYNSGKIKVWKDKDGNWNEGNSYIEDEQNVIWKYNQSLGNTISNTELTKTRRILEIQSDLFQKGRTAQLLTNSKDIDAAEKEGATSGREAMEWADELAKTKENQFLQLLNKDNNWVTLFIKSIIQDSAKKGYEKVLFPKGETASKIQGHEIIADEIKLYDNRISKLEDALIIPEKYKIEDGYFIPYNENTANQGVRAYTLKEFIPFVEQILEEELLKKQELKSQGIEKLKPIEAFYEIKIGNILRKIDPNIKVITDEYGNEWREYTIKPEDSNKVIQLQKQSPDNLTPENREDFEKKKALMLKNFPRIKRVIEDYSIDVAGRLEGYHTVRVNPNYWTKDTIGHEFGHLLIDMLGGVDNLLVRRGITQLIGKDLWNKVKKLYPDLYKNDYAKFQKEVLAWAIGLETADLFDTSESQTAWENWLMRLFDTLKKLLGIEKDAVKTLAKMVLGQRSISRSDLLSGEPVTYEMRARNYTVSEEDQPIDELERLRRKANDALERKYAIYRKRNLRSKEDNIKDTLLRLQELKDSPIESLKTFVKFAKEETDKIYKTWTFKKFKNAVEEDKPAFTVRELSNWKDYLSGFDLLEELTNSMFSLSVSRQEGLWQDEKMKKLSDEDFFAELQKLQTGLQADIKETISKKNEILHAYKTEGVKLMVSWMLPYSSHTAAIYKERFEREYNKLPKAERQKIDIDSYITKKIGEHSDSLEAESKLIIAKELMKAEGDINQMMRWVDNVLDSPDLIVSTMVKAFAETDHRSRERQIELRDEFLVKLRNLEDFRKKNSGMFSKDEDLYEGIIEKDDKGNPTGNLVNYSYQAMWDEYNDLSAKLQTRVSNGTLSYEDFSAIKQNWKNANVPLNNKAFFAAKKEYIQHLKDSGILSQKEINAINKNDNLFRKGAYESVLSLEKFINENAAELLTAWVIDNSRKYRTINPDRKIHIDPDTGRVTTEPGKTWYNPQWEKLVRMAGGTITNTSIEDQYDAIRLNKAENPVVDFYNFITQKTQEYQLHLPLMHRLQFRLPSVMKDFNQRIKAGQNLSTVLKGTIANNLGINPSYTERGDTEINEKQLKRTESRQLADESGNPINFLPVYFTGKLDVKDQSFDLADIYFKYFSMAIDYSEKSEILPEMEMARYLINVREISTIDTRGNPVYEAAIKLRKKELTSSGFNSMIAAQLNDWFEAVVYGRRSKDSGKVNFLGMEIDLSRAADMLNRYTSLSLLGANVVQGTANVILGQTLQTIEAFGGEHYSIKDFAKAKAYYAKNSISMLGDIGRRNPTNIINLLNEKFDILNEYPGGKFRKNTRFRQMLSSNSLFLTTHAGEHMMQSQVLVAMLNKKRAYDRDGKDLGSMLASTKVKGSKLVFEGPNGEKVVNFDDAEQFQFETQVRRILSRMHGEYSDLGRVAIQRYALGRMAYMFRKFLVPGWRRRFGKKHVNNLSESFVEGNYQAFARFLPQFFKDLGTFQVSLMSEHWQQLTRTEKANIKRTLGEIMFLTAAIILANIFSKAGEDDDENWWYSFLAYQALRLRAELAFYVHPGQSMQILRSPAASMSVVENTLKLFGQMVQPVFNGEFAFERYKRGNWKGRLKIEKTLINFVPGVKQMYRLRDVDDLATWLK